MPVDGKPVSGDRAFYKLLFARGIYSLAVVRNNKASAAQWGFVFQWHVQDEGVSEEFPQSQFSMLRAGPTYAAMNEEWDNGNFDPDSDDRAIADLRPNVWTSPSANWADQYFVGFKMHHIANKVHFYYILKKFGINVFSKIIYNLMISEHYRRRS